MKLQLLMELGQLSRKERERLQQRRDILDAAFILFSAKGYHQVSVQEIAEKAEFAIGSLYKFFQTKEELYKALLQEKFDLFHRELSESLSVSDDEVEQLRSYIKAKAESFRSNLSFIRLYLIESWMPSFNSDSGIRQEAQILHQQLLNKLAGVIESGIKKKRFRAVGCPFHLAVALDNAINGFILLWLAPGDIKVVPEEPEKILDVFLRGLTNE